MSVEGGPYPTGSGVVVVAAGSLTGGEGWYDHLRRPLCYRSRQYSARLIQKGRLRGLSPSPASLSRPRSPRTST